MKTFQEWIEEYARTNDDATTIAGTINRIIARLEIVLALPGLSESDRGRVEAKIAEWQTIRSQVMATWPDPPGPSTGLLDSVSYGSAQMAHPSAAFADRARICLVEHCPLDNAVQLCFYETIYRFLMQERESPQPPDRHRLEPPSGSDLPSDLAAFLKSQRLACLLLGTEGDDGSGFVIKAPGAEIEGLRGPLPILFRQELYHHPSSPVIRLLLRLYDRPPSSLAFESFVNIDDEEQRRDYGTLANQEMVNLYFYDEALVHRVTHQVRNSLRGNVPLVLAAALRLRARIVDDRFDFDRAKADVIARTSI